MTVDDNTSDPLKLYYQYKPYSDRAGRKSKHHWNKRQAGFVRIGGRIEGRCPSNLSLQVAETLLNQGIEFYPEEWVNKYPKCIFNFHEGVVYKAVITEHGQSYHGYPVGHPETIDLPASVKMKLLKLAEDKGCKKEIEFWLGKRSKRVERE